MTEMQIKANMKFARVWALRAASERRTRDELATAYQRLAPYKADDARLMRGLGEHHDAIGAQLYAAYYARKARSFMGVCDAAV